MQLLTFFSWPGATLATSFNVLCPFNFISHREQQDPLFYPNSIPPNTLTGVNSSDLNWIAFREHLGPSAAEELCKYMQHKRLKDAMQKHRHARTVRLWGRARVRVCACARARVRACMRMCVWLRQRDSNFAIHLDIQSNQDCLSSINSILTAIWIMARTNNVVIAFM